MYSVALSIQYFYMKELFKKIIAIQLYKISSHHHTQLSLTFSNPLARQRNKIQGEAILFKR